MKIVHSADLHLGYRQYGFHQREEDFYKIADHIAKRALALKADAMILAGDIFDAPKPPAVAVECVCNVVRKLNKANIPVLGIDGNHDSVGGNWLNVCNIEPLGIGSTTMFHSIDGITIAGINAMRPSMFHNTIDKLVANNVHVDILVIHQTLGEFADFDAESITAMEIAGKLAKIGVRYVAMGDLHDYHETVVGGIRFVYPGAPEVNAMDEKHDKVFSIIDITKDELKTSFEPLPTRPIIDISLDEEKELDTLLTTLDTKKDPLAIIWYDPEKRDLAKRAEKLLREKEILYRICPLAIGTENTIAAQLARQNFERKGAMLQLKDAVCAFFEENSEQYQLVFQLLNAPDNIAGIIKQYLDSKGITLEQIK